MNLFKIQTKSKNKFFIFLFENSGFQSCHKSQNKHNPSPLCTLHHIIDNILSIINRIMTGLYIDSDLVLLLILWQFPCSPNLTLASQANNYEGNMRRQMSEHETEVRMLHRQVQQIDRELRLNNSLPYKNDYKESESLINQSICHDMEESCRRLYYEYHGSRYQHNTYINKRSQKSWLKSLFYFLFLSIKISY